VEYHGFKCVLGVCLRVDKGFRITKFKYDKCPERGMVERKKYKCLKCKFSFLLGDNRAIRCPNCGSESDMIEEVIQDSNSAQRIVDNSEGW